MTVSYPHDNMIREAVKTLQSIVTTKPVYQQQKDCMYAFSSLPELALCLQPAHAAETATAAIFHQEAY